MLWECVVLAVHHGSIVSDRDSELLLDIWTVVDTGLCGGEAGVCRAKREEQKSSVEGTRSQNTPQ